MTKKLIIGGIAFILICVGLGVYLGSNNEPTREKELRFYGDKYIDNIVEKKYNELRINKNCKKDSGIDIEIECTKKLKSVEANKIINDGIYNGYLK